MLYATEMSVLLAGGVMTISTPALLAACSLLHYLKRWAEILFVHAYTPSSRVETICAVSICGWYASNVLITVWLSMPDGWWGGACGSPPDGSLVRIVGLSLWVIGETGNAYHHLLLRWLRTGGRADPSMQEGTHAALTGKYKLPMGGLFQFVGAPHYFCEMINWFGIAIMTGHSVVWVMHCVNLTYLGGRSVLTSRYYREKINGYPAERKHMVPFVF